MPLLNKKPFVPLPIPEGLNPNDEVFYLDITNEIFTSHDEFFDRFLYCNSLIWTCSRTGKQGLTYKEALDSEQQLFNKRKRVKSQKPQQQQQQQDSAKPKTPKTPKTPKQTSTTTTTTTTINGDKENPSPTDNESYSEELQSNDNKKKKKKKYPYDPKKYSMPVPEGFDPSLLTPTGKIDGRKLKSIKNRQLAEELLQASGYDETKLEEKKRQLHCQTDEGLDDGYDDADEQKQNPNQSPDTHAPKKGKKKKKDKEEEARKKELEAQKKAQMQAELAREKEEQARQKKEAVAAAKQLERQKKEEERKKAAAFLQNWDKKCEDLQRDDLRKLPQPTPIACDIPEKLFGDSLFILESLYNLHEVYQVEETFSEGITYDILEEILLDRHEDSSLATIIQFLLKIIFKTQPTGDGYGLDDDSAASTTTPTTTTATNHNTEAKANDTNNHSTTNNTDSKSDTKNHGNNHTKKPEQNGLGNNHHHNNNHNDENGEINGVGSDNDEDHDADEDHHVVEEEEDDKEVRMNDLIGAAIRAAIEVRKSLQQPLIDMELDTSNTTEVLRLHLLQSGSFPKGRTIYNGWYSSREDPGLWLCMEEPDLIKKLGEVTIFDLEIEERIKILHTLLNQIFSFIKTRQYVESASDQLVELRKEYRSIAAAFGRWDRENCVKRLQESEQQPPAEGETAEEAERRVQLQQQNQVDYDDYQREKAIRQEQVNEQLLEIRKQIRNTQAVYGIHPIGRDRAYRRYWIFQSLPGLFVEHDDDYLGQCLDSPTPLESQYKKLFDKENPMMLHNNNNSNNNSNNNTTNSSSVIAASGDNGVDSSGATNANNATTTTSEPALDEQDYCTANEETCAIHGQRRIQGPKWWFYHTSESIDLLVERLNKRGHREGKLQDVLATEMSLIKPIVTSCPAYKLNRDILEQSGIRRSGRLRTKGGKRRGRHYDRD